MREKVLLFFLETVKRISYTKYADLTCDLFLWKRIVVPFLCEYESKKTFVDGNLVSFFDCKPFRRGILGLFVSFEDYLLRPIDILASLYLSRREQVNLNHDYLEEVSQALVMEIRKKVKTDFLLSSLANFFERTASDVSLDFDRATARSFLKDSAAAYTHYFNLFDRCYGEKIIVYYPNSSGFVDYDRTHSITVHADRRRITQDGFFLIGFDYAIEKDGNKEWIRSVHANRGENYYEGSGSFDDSKRGKVIWRQ